jgi:hypothetical protein
VAPDLVLTSAGALCPSGERVRAVLADGRELRGETVRSDTAELGLALVRFPEANATNTEPIAIGDASVLRVGDRIVIFDDAAGRFEARQGVVAEKAHSVFGVGFLRVEPAPASQGSPILDGIGRVVGIVSAPPDPSIGPGFVIPVNYIYSGSPRLIEPPTRQRPDVEGWNQYLTRVLDADREEVQRFISEVPQPALLSLDPSPSGSRGLVATFLRHAVDKPEPQVLRLTVRTPERDLCQASAYVLGWSRVDPASPGRVAAGSRYFQWLRANNLLLDAYQGFGTLDLAGCPERELRGAEVVLDGADERADRIRL